MNDALRQRFEDGAAGGGRQTDQFRAGLRGQVFRSAAGVFQSTALDETRPQRLAFVIVRTAQDLPYARGQSLPPVCEQADQGERQFLLLQVGAQRFAGRLFLADEVEQIVGDLERHPHIAAIARSACTTSGGDPLYSAPR